MKPSGPITRSLQDAEWLTRGSLSRLLGVLSGDGEEARVVGGAVRNALMFSAAATSTSEPPLPRTR